MRQLSPIINGTEIRVEPTGRLAKIRIECLSAMLQETLNNYFPIQEEELINVLEDPEFESFVRNNRLSNGKHCIKVKFEGRIAARSVEFECESDRDNLYRRLIDEIYVDLHGRHQRLLEF